MTSACIVPHGYFGDHFFASSIAKKLIEEHQFDTVDFVVGFPQLIPFFELNPYISNVIYSGAPGPSPVVPRNNNYNKIIQLGTISLKVPPAIEMQLRAGVKSPSPEFVVYTDPTLDASAKQYIDSLRVHNVPIIAIMNNWKSRAFGFNEYEYWNGVDIPYLGYGGRLRDTDKIIETLKNEFVTILVGTPPGVTQFDTTLDKNQRTLLEEASILKFCDYFIGAEGGLANIAGGVGCKTILTGDFLAMLYGPRGCINPVGNPALGPHLYFPEVKHSMLNPFLSDEDVATTIIDIIKNDRQLIYDWNTNTGGTLHD